MLISFQETRQRVKREVQSAPPHHSQGKPEGSGSTCQRCAGAGGRSNLRFGPFIGGRRLFTCQSGGRALVPSTLRPDVAFFCSSRESTCYLPVVSLRPPV